MLLAGLVVLCARSALGADCVRAEGSRGFNEEARLRTDLLCGYDVNRAPRNLTDVITLSQLKHFYLDEEEKVFTTHIDIHFLWNDERLKWDPSDYDGVLSVLVDGYQIWTPRLKDNNDVVYYEDFNEVSRYGNVLCFIKASSRSQCNSDLTNWPYDVQSCSVNYGVFYNHTDTDVVTFDSYGISTLGTEFLPGWNLMDYEKVENKTSDTEIYFTFLLERRSPSLECIVVVPSLTLSVLTVSSLFLDAGGARGAVALLSLSSHFYIQTFLNASIPKQSSTAPSILRYVSASLALTSIAIVLSFVLSSLRTRRVPPPAWVVAVNQFAFKTPAKFLIVPRWGARRSEPAADQTNTDVEAWTDFANVINGASIIIAILVYVTLSLSFMPRQMPIDYTPL